MRTEDLIVQLARAADPVSQLPSLPGRMTRWTMAAVPMAALGIVAIGPRTDVLTAIRQPAFVATSVATLVTAVLAAAGAFVLSVPGRERSPLPRVLPLLAGGAWMMVLAASLVDGGDPIRRMTALPFHLACVLEIAGLGVIPGWMLFRMLKRAAPLRLTWSAALAALAAAALAAAATQIICPIDDPAHQLVGHVLPVALLALLGAFAGRRSLDWLAGA